MVPFGDILFLTTKKVCKKVARWPRGACMRFCGFDELRTQPHARAVPPSAASRSTRHTLPPSQPPQLRNGPPHRVLVFGFRE